MKFAPKSRRGKKEVSTSQGSPSVGDLTRLFQTPPPQQPVQGATCASNQQGPIQVAAPTITQQQPVQAIVAWRPQNASPLKAFTIYRDMPKNLEHFYYKFHVNDINCTADEHIKIFEDTLQNRNIQNEDVAYKLFLYSLGEEAFYWYINLSVDSIATWQQMKDTFLGKFRLPISPAEIYKQFIEVTRQEHEPIGFPKCLYTQTRIKRYQESIREQNKK